MFETTKGFDATVKFDGAKRKSIETPLRSFYDFLARRIHLWHANAKLEDNEAGASLTPVEVSPPLLGPVNRVTKQGRFDWGSFSAFEDGSIELEIAGIKQRFRDFSELKHSLKHSDHGTYLDKNPDKNSRLTSSKQ
jgi:hypothetical protein